VDSDGFRRLMAEQRRRAKADSMARKTGHTDLSAYRGVLDSARPSTFTGYVEVATEATVRGLRWPPRRPCAGCFAPASPSPLSPPARRPVWC